MISQELIEEAKEKYPLGTKVVCLMDEFEYFITDHSDRYLKESMENDSIWFKSGALGVKVYESGEWAKVVTPNKKQN